MNLCQHGNRIDIDYCQECRRLDHLIDLQIEEAEREHLRSLPPIDAGNGDEGEGDSRE